MKIRSIVSLTAIVAVLVFGVVYMTVGVLHFDPRKNYITADLHLAESGGLGANSPVLFSGVQVGKAESVRKQAAGVVVRLKIDERYHIPAASDIHVEQLSALGEPYIAFAPASEKGPYLRDGQDISTERVQVPMDITALSTRAVDLLKQIHPEAVSHLVDTFDTALAGTDQAMQTLQRSSDLLAATLLSRTSAIRQLFTDMQAIGGNMDWLGPSLETAGPQLGKFGTMLIAIVESGSVLSNKQPVDNYYTGDGLVPFLGQLTDLLNKIGPSVAPLGPALQPVVTEAVHSTPHIDVSALIGQALQSVDPDGALHFRINVK
ncbi:Mce family protein MceF [Nocardia nova SH22a]|uniref:Mce family protein MceF n=1 Tax=Nocardia nova SH22a TaxID=1415166 RepID=W5TK15_9NOCA|nr:MlaD family protein [Nocardia nova]AHH19567.1 Mce family protein MceF [Nocardia nova SH22a]